VVLEEAPAGKDFKDLKDVKDSKDEGRKAASGASFESFTSFKSFESLPPQLLVLSARTPTALERAAANLASHLEHHPGLPLADVAFTLQVGRKPFEHRRAVVCRTPEEAIAGLRAPGAPPEEAHLPEPARALLQSWLAGEDVDWSPLHAGAAPAKRRRVPLPTYPFEKQRHWVEASGPDIPRFTPPEELQPEPGLVGSVC
jgi:acyl transferase domain-containing protein